MLVDVVDVVEVLLVVVELVEVVEVVLVVDVVEVVDVVDVELVLVVDVLVVEVVDVDVVLVVVEVVHAVVVRQPTTGGHGIGGTNDGEAHEPQPVLHPDELDHELAESYATQRHGPHGVVLLVLDVDVVLVVLQHGSVGPVVNVPDGQ